MLKRYILSIVTSFFIISLLLFLSCANQEQVENDELDSLAGETAEAINDEILGVNEIDVDSEEVVQNTPKEEPKSKTEEADEDLALYLPTEEDLANLEKEETPSEVPEKIYKEPSASNATEKKEEQLELTDDILGIPSEAEIEKYENLNTELEKSPSKPRYKGKIGKSSIPIIPNKAIQKNGILVNRYYFLRLNDSPSSVSSLIYGTPNFATQLTKINPGKWYVGKLIYYKSQKASDKNMISYYEEEHIAPVEYVVKKGDWLSLIAKKELGSIQSWKELVIMNNLSNPNIIEPGQRIVFFTIPQDGIQPIVKNTQQIESQESEIIPNQKQLNDDFTLDEAETVQNQKQASKELEEKPSPPPPPEIQQQVKKATSTLTKRKANIIKLINQNLFSIMIGVGILLLLIALMLAKKKRNQMSTSANSEEDSLDDDIFNDKAKK